MSNVIDINRPWTNDSPWTPDHVETLRQLWDKGLSCSHIAAQLGDWATRNSVIGKARRIGLPMRRAGHLIRPRKDAPDKPTAESPDVATPIPMAARRGVIELEPDQCRWPIGDPRNADFHFCDQPRTLGQPYCEPHCRRAFLLPQPTSRYAARAPAASVRRETATATAREMAEV